MGHRDDQQGGVVRNDPVSKMVVERDALISVAVRDRSPNENFATEQRCLRSENNGVLASLKEFELRSQPVSCHR